MACCLVSASLPKCLFKCFLKYLLLTEHALDVNRLLLSSICTT